MAVVKLNNIRPEMLRWAIERAGYNEESAEKRFPQVELWLSGEKKPTVRQLQTFAQKFYVPFGYLFLTKPPVEKIPFPMFRGTAGIEDKFDLNVYDTVLDIQRRQDWLEDYLTENELDTCSFIGCVSLQTPIGKTVDLLRQILHLDSRWAFSLANSEAAVNKLSQQLEEAGVFVAYNGIVGNNTHRPVQVDECRGFALVNSVAPYIFINSTDSKAAQLFTLVHETAHLMLGISAGHAGEEDYLHDTNEHYCDAVAAEFLVAADLIREMWNDSVEIKKLAHRFKVSEIVVARRAHDLRLLSDADYRSFWLQYSHRPHSNKKNTSGGNFYLTSVKRVGRTFAIHVRNAVNSRQLSYTEAYRLTGLYGTTYQNFMEKNI